MAQMTFKNVKADEVFADYSRNFRMESSYGECEPIQGFNPEKDKPNLYEDIKTEGIHTPLLLVTLDQEESERLSAVAGRKIKYRVLRGHRRYRVVENIRRDFPHLLETIPANIYSGLSNADEIKLMVDGVHIKSFNEYELFDAIRKLVLNTNMSEEQIGLQIGYKRGYVQRRKWIMKLPTCVEQEWKKRFEKDAEGNAIPCVKFTDPDLVELYKAFGRDEEAGRDADRPGSEFRNAWERLVDKGTLKGNEPKAWTRKDMLEKLQWIKDPIIKIVIQACAGEAVKLTDAEAQILALRNRLAEAENVEHVG